jgi:osmoprotectant transport system permease protein
VKMLGVIVLPVLLIAMTPLVAPSTDKAPPEVKIGSKAFTESVILADIVSLLVRNAGAHPVQRRELGGTRMLWNTLLRGEIDIYPEYTGTIGQEIFPGQGTFGDDTMKKILAAHGT